MPTRQAAAFVALGAVLLAASYPPFPLPVVSFLAVAPAVILLRRFEGERDPRAALRWGFWYGFAAHGAALYWLVVALWHFTPRSALGYLATIAIFGLWHALLFWLSCACGSASPWCRCRWCFRSRGRRSSGQWAIR